MPEQDEENVEMEQMTHKELQNAIEHASRQFNNCQGGTTQSLMYGQYLAALMEVQVNRAAKEMAIEIKKEGD